MRVGIQGLVDVLDANPVADPLFQYGFTNYGKTPAFLTELCIEYCIQPALPERPIYRKPIMLAGMVVIPAEKDSPALDERWRVMFDKYFLRQEFEPIRQGNSQLFLYGYFRYRDVFETRYRIGFAFGFTASMAPLVYTSRDAPAYVYREKENS